MDSKHVLKSRSLWATMLPIVTLIGNQLGFGSGFGQAVDMAVTGAISVFAIYLEWRHQRNPQPTHIAKLPGAAIIAAVALGLAGAPAQAQDAQPAPPLFGCGGGVCSIYLVSAGWTPYTPGNGPLRIGGNLVDFVSGGVGIGLGGIHVEGDLNYLGGVCRIPKVGPALSFACGGVDG